MQIDGNNFFVVQVVPEIYAKNTYFKNSQMYIFVTDCISLILFQSSCCYSFPIFHINTVLAIFCRKTENHSVFMPQPRCLKLTNKLPNNSLQLQEHSVKRIIIYVACYARVLVWSYLAGRSPEKLVIDLLAQQSKSLFSKKANIHSTY